MVFIDIVLQSESNELFNMARFMSTQKSLLLKALKYYYQLLSECESSLLVEPIRLHIRKLSKPNES